MNRTNEPSNQRAQLLEQMELHLLVAEGELAAVIDVQSARDRNYAEHLNRLRLAQTELHQAQVELHRLAQIIGAASLASKRLDYLVNPASITANQLELEVNVLGSAAHELRVIYHALGGQRDIDEHDDILTQAQRKNTNKKRLALIALMIGLPIYAIVIINQYYDRPDEIRQAVLAETQNFCEAFSNCKQPPEDVVLNCIPQETPFERLVYSWDSGNDILVSIRESVHSCLLDYALKSGMKLKGDRPLKPEQ